MITLVAWLWIMTAQGASNSTPHPDTIYGPRSYCAWNGSLTEFPGCTPQEIMQIVDSCYAGTQPCEHHAPTKPAEHVIEIRTKRDSANVKCPDTHGTHQWDDPATRFSDCTCPNGFKVDIENNGAITNISCIRVRKELWIDGQRIGVIRETEETVDSPSK